MKAITERTLTIAAGEVGVREVNLGNHGKRVDEYIKRAGLRPPCSWCMCFVYWCIDEAALTLDEPNPFLKGGFCPYVDHWARQEGILHASPALGDVFLLYGSRAHHTGLVQAVQGDRILTLEGNTNDNGSSNGDGVYRRTRTLGPHLQFVRWETLVQEAETPARDAWSLFLNAKYVSGLLLRNNRTHVNISLWAQALGLEVGWDDNHKAFTIGGKRLEAGTFAWSGMTLAPVRDLAELAGLRLDVNAAKRTITAHR